MTSRPSPAGAPSSVNSSPLGTLWPLIYMASILLSVNISLQWREDCLSASLVNHGIETDATIWQSCFDLPRHTCSLLNCFQTGQGPGLANLNSRHLAKSTICEYGQQQTTSHVVDVFQSLHTVYDDTLNYRDCSTSAMRWTAILAPRVLPFEFLL